MVLFGSYSIEKTFPGTSTLLCLKSISLYDLLAPPPQYLLVILPLLFLPQDLISPFVADFKGAVFDNRLKSYPFICLLDGVVGAYDFINIMQNYKSMRILQIICGIRVSFADLHYNYALAESMLYPFSKTTIAFLTPCLKPL